MELIPASAITKKIPIISADKGFKQLTELDLELIVPIL